MVETPVEPNPAGATRGDLCTICTTRWSPVSVLTCQSPENGDARP
ncbi:hypothetical protein [Amycolatopsis sulphurea]|nr:hypothetical protein [Amycolatopsis sulphurea]